MCEIMSYSGQFDPRCNWIRLFGVRAGRVCITAFLVLLIGSGISPQLMSQTHSDALEFGQGLLIDPARELAYLMRPGGGVEAVNLADGSIVWSNDLAARPLALSGDLLISQTQTAEQGSRLGIVILNVADGGRRTVTDSVSLPSNVRVSVDEMLTGAFTTQAHVIGQDAYITWDYTLRPRTGAWQPEDSDSQKESGRRPDTFQRSRGALLVNIASGVLSTLEYEDLPEAAIPKPAKPDPKDLLDGVPQPQYLSADGKHVLTSQRIADEKAWEKYRWMVYDGTTGDAIGSFRCHLSRAPFMVVGSHIVFQTGPYARRIDQTMVDEPLKIRAVDLGTGQEIWSREVRDTKYRGPFPP